jgi:hypothetical protein
MFGIAAGLGVLAIAFAWFGLIRSVRDKSMRSLAARLGFQYTDRTLPAGFPSAYEPFDKIRLVWNVMQGRLKDASIVVFDGVFGTGRGVHRTFIAVQTPGVPCPKNESFLGNVMQSSGWVALYGHQATLNLVPWSMSTERIEEHLRGLKL